jgi:hypothetical protein
MPTTSAALFPEDRARSAKVTTPDHSGTTCDVGWAAWEKTMLGSATTYLEAALCDAEGRIYAQRDPRGGGRRSAWHTFASLYDLRLYCLRYRLRDMGDGIPFTVQQKECREVWQILADRRIGPYADEIGRDRVITHTRRQNGQITHHHRIKD